MHTHTHHSSDTFTYIQLGLSTPSMALCKLYVHRAAWLHRAYNGPGGYDGMDIGCIHTEVRCMFPCLWPLQYPSHDNIFAFPQFCSHPSC